MKLPGIVFFAFNRPALTERCLAALARNTRAAQCDLTIYCDGPRHAQDVPFVEATRDAAHSATGFKSVTVIAREKNLGCAASVIAGISESFQQYDRLAVFEDDILTSPHTLSYLAASLERYECEPSIFSVSAWSPPSALLHISEAYPFDAYCIPRCNIWGWATWRDRWQSVDWAVTDYESFRQNAQRQGEFNRGGEDLASMLHEQMAGRIDAWDIRMDYARFKQNCVGLNPVRSYTTNIGMGSGTHTTEYTTRWDNDISLALPVEDSFRWPKHGFVDAALLGLYRKIYRAPWTWRLFARKFLAFTGVLEHVRRVRRTFKR